jgi:hypothetical protein
MPASRQKRRGVFSIDICQRQFHFSEQSGRRRVFLSPGFVGHKLPLADINAENAAMHAGQSSEEAINGHVDGWIKAGFFSAQALLATMCMVFTGKP